MHDVNLATVMGPQPGQLETALGLRWKHQEGSVHFPLGGAELIGSELGGVGEGGEEGWTWANFVTTGEKPPAEENTTK